MPGAATPRLGLIRPLGTDAVQQLRLSIGSTQDSVEANTAIDGQGSLASRPVSTAPTPGIRGRYYFVTGDPDTTQNNRLWRDMGTSWVEVGSTLGGLAVTGTGPGSITIAAQNSLYLGTSGGQANVYATSTNRAAMQFSNTGGDFGQGFTNIYGTVFVYKQDGVTYENIKAASFVVNSDKVFKKDVEPISSPLAVIGSLKGVYHGWVDKGNDRKDFGFIAQDVQKVVPELVATSSGAGASTLGIDYMRVVPILVEAVKAQQKQIATLTARVTALEKA